MPAKKREETETAMPTSYSSSSTSGGSYPTHTTMTVTAPPNVQLGGPGGLLKPKTAAREKIIAIKKYLASRLHSPWDTAHNDEAAHMLDDLDKLI